MQRKNISVVVAGSGEIRDLEIAPGVTVKEALNEAGLQGYQLSRKGNDKPLEPGTNLYDLVDNKEKLYATPEDVTVGSSTAAPSGAKLLRTYPYVDPHDFSVRKVVLKGIRRFEPQKDVLVVGRDQELPYWQQNGWLKRGNTYQGYYRTSYGNWEGLIEEEYVNSYSFFIYNPPNKLKFSRHWDCFAYKGDGKYSIHFSEKPEDISSGIIVVERLISEAFKNHNNGGKRWKRIVLDLVPSSWRY
jgi:hypothetical protein